MTLTDAIHDCPRLPYPLREIRSQDRFVTQSLGDTLTADHSNPALPA